MLCKCSACKADVVLPEDSNTTWHACWQVWIPIWNLTVEIPWQYKCGAQCSRKLTGEIGALNGLFSACWVTPTSPTDAYYKHPYDYHLYFTQSSNGRYSVGSWAVCYKSSGTYSWGGPSPSSSETDVPFYYFGLALTDALYSQNTSYIYSFIVDGSL